LYATYGMRYKVQVPSGVLMDLNNNAFPGLIGSTYTFHTVVDQTAPTLIGYSPAQGRSGIAANTSITLTFSEDVQAGVGSIILTPGPVTTPGAAFSADFPPDAMVIPVVDAQVSYSGPVMMVIPSSPLLLVGCVYSVTMAHGTVKDIAIPSDGGDSNKFLGVFGTSWQFSVPDTAAPTVSSYSPPQGATDATSTGNLVLTFSENVRIATGTITIVPDGASPIVIDMNDETQVTVSGSTLTIDPVMNLLITNIGVYYTITMTAASLVDTNNNYYAGISGTLYRIRTNPDVYRPTILSFSPLQGAVDIPQTPNLVLVFNEAVQASTGDIVLTPDAGPNINIPIGDSQVTFAGSMCIINPSTLMLAGLQYTMVVAMDVIRDTYGGNGWKGVGNVEATHTYQFTTASSSDSVRVTFKSGGEAGYLTDYGNGFSYQNGTRFGWKCDGIPKAFTAGIRTFGVMADRNNECTGVTTWEIAMANGEYSITVVMPQNHHTTCKVQGVSTGGASGLFTYTTTIEVTDGFVKLEGDFPNCDGYQEVVITAPTDATDHSCSNKLDGLICGPNQELHIPDGECIMMVKPASSACNSDTSTVPLNPLTMVPVPNDPKLVPYLTGRI